MDNLGIFFKNLSPYFKKKTIYPNSLGHDKTNLYTVGLFVI